MPQTIFTTSDVRPGQTIHLSSFQLFPWPKYGDIWPWIVIPETEHGDYYGGTAEASNYRVMLADESVAPHVLRIIGSHGYRALAFEAYLGPVPLSERLVEYMEGLAHYPIADDDDDDDDDDEHDLQQELASEAWADHGRADFRKALVGVLNSIDPGHEHDLDHGDPEPLDELWREGVETYGVQGGAGHVIETGGGVYFDIDEWCAKAYYAPQKLAELQSLALASRVTEAG